MIYQNKLDPRIRFNPTTLNQRRANNIRKEKCPLHISPLHCLPEILRVEESREFRVDIDNMNVTFLDVSNDGLVIVAGIVSFDVNAQRSKHLEFESILSR